MSLHVHLVPSLAGAGAGSSVTVEGPEAHHAVAVRRLTVGQPVVLTDGGGTVAECEVSETGRQRLVAVVRSVASVPRPEPELIVVQALPKGDRGELAVETLTEVGVARIVPWAASRSVAVWRGDRAAKSLAKWQSSAREAAKQARRAWFPEVLPMASTEAVAELLASASLAVVLHEEGADSLAGAEVPYVGPLVLVVGPEGGLTAEEVATFAEAGAHIVRLGVEVLRTSTAGVAAAAALLARTERWGASPREAAPPG